MRRPHIKLQVKGGKTQADGFRSNISPEKSKGEKDRDQGGGCHGRQVLEEDHLLLLGEDRAAASLPGAGPPPTNPTTQPLPAPVLPTKQLNCSNFPPIWEIPRAFHCTDCNSVYKERVSINLCKLSNSNLKCCAHRPQGAFWLSWLRVVKIATMLHARWTPKVSPTRISTDELQRDRHFHVKNKHEVRYLNTNTVCSIWMKSLLVAVPPHADANSNQCCLFLTQYHHVSTSSAPYWPSTIMYQPVPPYSDNKTSDTLCKRSFSHIFFPNATVTVSLVDLRWAQLYVVVSLVF